MSWMRPRDHNVFANVGSLVLCGALAGVVVAAALFPGVAMSGLLTRAGLQHFDELPSELRVQDVPQISYIYASDGETPLATMYDENRRNIPLDQVPQVMIDALLAAEDHNFYEHNGIDVRGIARAFVANVGADEITQGASTVTQQFVRLALTYFAESPQEIVEATEDTTARKLREARLAMAVEKEMDKPEILERYFNLAYFGEGAYGVFAASQVYFSKQPKDLEIHEAAMLAGLVKAPSRYSPAENVEVATERRNWVIDQMVEVDAITPSEASEAKAVELQAQAQRQPNECVSTPENHWGFFCDYFYRWWMEQEEFGSTEWERERRLKGGGYSIVTTLDVDAQQAMKQNVDDRIGTSDNQPHALMLAAVEPGSGKVRAMATNRTFSLDESGNGPHTNPRRPDGATGTYPNTTNPLMAGGGDITGYQAGSTFKIFTMIAALEEDLPLAYTLPTPYRLTTDFPVAPGGSASCGEQWCPVNYTTGLRDQANMWTGFGESINTYFAGLIEQVGADKAVDVAQRLGIEFRDPDDADFAERTGHLGWGAFTLGVSDTTPLDLATAFAAISAEGVYCEPLPVEEIRTTDGESLALASPSCSRAIDKDVARAAIDAGRCVIGAQSTFGRCAGGTEVYDDATGMATTQLIDVPVWGKTGTTDSDRVAALTLATSRLAVSGMLADPDWAQTNADMSHDIVNPAVVYTMGDAMEGVDASDWPAPSEERALGDQIGIPDVECQPMADARATLEDAGFRVRVGAEVDSSCQAGFAAGTSPSGRTVRNGLVTILESNGSGYEEPQPDPTQDPPGNGDGGDGGDGDGGDDDDGGNGGGGGGTPTPPGSGSSSPPAPTSPPGTPDT